MTTRSKPLSTETLRLHIESLCKQHAIKWKIGDRPCAYLNESRIVLRPIKSRVTYAIALHELGHLLSHSRSKPRLFQEGEAWAWARQNALVWSPSMERTMVSGLRTYLEQAAVEHRHNVPGALRLPPVDHPFWTPLRKFPETRSLLRRAPTWLRKDYPAVPWGEVLAHEDRPRCENCEFWRHVATYNTGDTPEKRAWGECCHKLRPLGVEMTPGGALCGSSWLRLK